MKYDLNIVAVGVEKKGSVVTGMVISLTRRTIVSASVLKANGVESFNRCTISCLKGQVVTPSKLTLGSLALRTTNEKLISPEVIGRLPTKWNTEDLQYSLIKPTTDLDVSHNELNVIN